MERILVKTGSVVALSIMLGSLAWAQDPASPAQLALNSTKTTNSTYSLYIWNRITKHGEPAFEEGSAEFHKGDLHRVETPRDRMVANCRKKTGVYYSVASGEVIEGPNVAAVACGINTNVPIISLDLVNYVPTKFGIARRVRLVDKDYVREYDVLKNGALARTTYVENRPKGEQVVFAEALRVEPRVPSGDIFSKASLKRRYLPQEPEK
ncbi:MAG TPA: hypothetical protein PKA59_05290 [Chakrabartia sp.]|nr:hypothetical protein [Chakrabartia sp.]